MSFRRYILASRSPRRLELLQQVVHRESDCGLPTRFIGRSGVRRLSTTSTPFRRRMFEIARHKAEQVRNQLERSKRKMSLFERPRTLIIAADTTVIVDDVGQRTVPLVLGQPPVKSTDWREVVANVVPGILRGTNSSGRNGRSCHHTRRTISRADC